MPPTTTWLTAAVEAYFSDLRKIRASGGATGERSYYPALGNAADSLGDATYDVHFNDRAYWRNVPAAVWSYKLGGYQVLKKWLSYRERGVLDRPLKPEEVQHFTDTSRRIAGILGLVGEG